MKQDLKQCGGIGEAMAEDSLVIQDYLAHSKYHDIKATIYQQEQKLEKLENTIKNILAKQQNLNKKLWKTKKQQNKLARELKN